MNYQCWFNAIYKLFVHRQVIQGLHIHFNPISPGYVFKGYFIEIRCAFWVFKYTQIDDDHLCKQV